MPFSGEGGTVPTVKSCAQKISSYLDLTIGAIFIFSTRSQYTPLDEEGRETSGGSSLSLDKAALGEFNCVFNPILPGRGGGYIVPALTLTNHNF